MLTLLVSMALAASPGSAVGANAPAPDAAFPDRNTLLARALSLRDGVPCAELPVVAASELVAWTTPDLGPPWVSLRATACLAERFPDTAGRLALGWVGDPKRQGLVLAVLQHEGSLPESMVVELGRAALADPTLRPRVARFLRKSRRPAVQALLTAP